MSDRVTEVFAAVVGKSISKMYESLGRCETCGASDQGKEKEFASKTMICANTKTICKSGTS